MRYQWAVVILWFGSVLSYAAWKGNARPTEQLKYFNSRGEQIYPSVAKSMEQAAAKGSALYYTGADGQIQTDIYTQTLQQFNWEAFFQVSTFGFGLALLLLIVVRLFTRFANENITK